MLKEGEIMALPGAQTPECAAIARNHGRPPPGCSFGVPCKHEREMSAIMLLFEIKKGRICLKRLLAKAQHSCSMIGAAQTILCSSDESHLHILRMLG